MLRGRSRRWLATTFPSGGRALFSLAIIAVILAMIVSLSSHLINQIIIARQLDHELTVAQQSVSELAATNQALADQLAYEQSDAATEAWARDLGLVRDGDIVIVPERQPTSISPPLPADQPSLPPLPPPPPNWQRWWQAFFP